MGSFEEMDSIGIQALQLQRTSKPARSAKLASFFGVRFVLFATPR
jgi:hypothetical protein